MINFNLYNTCYTSWTDEDCQQYTRYIESLKQEIWQINTDKFMLGAKLKDFFHTKSYRIKSKEAVDFYKGSYLGGSNCHSSVFFYVCENEFGLDKSTVSRLINIVDEFGNKSIGYKDQWKKFRWSALVELLPLTEEQRKPVQADWTIKQIREYKRNLVATSQQKQKISPNNLETNMELVHALNFYRGWSHRAMCEEIVTLKQRIKELTQYINFTEEEEIEELSEVG